MITNQDRTKWIGASDTAMVMGNWKTATFEEWFFEKIDLGKKYKYNSWAMQCGNILEHQIIDTLDELERKRTKKGKRPYFKRSLGLRVNYDGLRREEIIEIKTSIKEWRSLPKKYWEQVQVLMYVKRKKKARIVAYIMTDNDYINPYFADIDTKRLRYYEIPFDKQWITNQYIPRLKYLARCIRKKIFPTEWEYWRIIQNEIKSAV